MCEYCGEGFCDCHLELNHYRCYAGQWETVWLPKLESDSEEIIVCYEDGVIPTTGIEWRRFEGDLAEYQTSSGWQIDLRDLYAVDYSHCSDGIPF